MQLHPWFEDHEKSKGLSLPQSSFPEKVTSDTETGEKKPVKTPLLLGNIFCQSEEEDSMKKDPFKALLVVLSTYQIVADHEYLYLSVNFSKFCNYSISLSLEIFEKHCTLSEKVLLLMLFYNRKRTQ